ncbi:hypothetical protein NDU88_000339 [Pleurodeles waltl]|uniref:Uncharacterized protein n=1 Tax=Pleurodeles waltl TaxID=8319 RepID=A0AAV7UQI4_PLEWA|nr:hypothetical protein NDU88_000339 [Pleurodeles waltl]
MRRTAPLVPKRLCRPSASSNSRLTPDLLLLSHSVSSGSSAPYLSAAQRASARPSGVPPSLHLMGRHIFLACVSGLVVPGLLFGPFQGFGRKEFPFLSSGGGEEAMRPQVLGPLWAGFVCSAPLAVRRAVTAPKSRGEARGRTRLPPRPGSHSSPGACQFQRCPALSAFGGEALMCSPDSGLGTPCSARFRASAQGNLLSSPLAPDPGGGGKGGYEATDLLALRDPYQLSHASDHEAPDDSILKVFDDICGYINSALTKSGGAQ